MDKALEALIELVIVKALAAELVDAKCVAYTQMDSAPSSHGVFVSLDGEGYEIIIQRKK